MQTILSVNNVSKSYGPLLALNSVSFNVPAGSVFGILGPNGSGKTTMLGIILNVLKANAGSYNWFEGMQPDEARRQIGSLLETPNFYHYMSAWDNLDIAASIKQRGFLDRQQVLDTVGLLSRKDSKFQTYSLGMKQRLAIGAALLGAPKVLVFDEPTNGLDPAGIAEIRELIRKLNNEGITIIMASHLLDEVEKVCTHVAILKKGNLLLSGPVNEALRNEDTVEIGSADILSLEQIIAGMPGITQVKKVNGYLQLACSSSVNTAMINEYCISKGVVLSHLSLRKKSLETKFMELTN